MNQKEIWCVVKPTVGLPLFLGSVALTSLAVHYAILSHTTWMASYWQGKAVKTSDAGPITGAPALAGVVVNGGTSRIASK
jgi:light-harvesting protein B-800-850 alpha chain